MNSRNHIPHAVFKNAFGITDHLKPLKQRKSPAVASACGFTFGGLGLGLYFQNWTDFFLPVAIWLVIMVLAAPTGELLLVTAPVFCAILWIPQSKGVKCEIGCRRERRGNS